MLILGWEYHGNEKGKGMIPIVNASFNLTQRCGLSCEYCFSGEKSDKTMTLDTAKKCVDFLIKQAVEAKDEELINHQRAINVSFWGGEPLLEWQLLKDIVLYAESVIPKGVGLQFGGTTNGMLLTPDKFDFLDKHKIFFMVSLDGTAATHDKYRIQANGTGSHKHIMKNMKQVIERWPFYKVRTSPYPERIDHFYEDIKYLVDHKMYNIMFSPVYEHEWTDAHWQTWKEQCFKVVDMIAEYKKKGIKIEIEHFKTYCRSDNSKWPCGAGRFYCGFDSLGEIYPCHRFIKFADQRPWQEKEMCIGHVDYGITKPELRNQFIDFKPECGDCEYKLCTPCNGGCYGISFDLTGKIYTPHPGICKYVAMQHEVSLYLKEKVGEDMPKNGKSCVCNNLQYLDGSENGIVNVDNSGMQCHCYNTNYTGDPDTARVTRPIKPIQVNPYDILKRVEALERRIVLLESKGA
jgi:uncharacterized protein